MSLVHNVIGEDIRRLEAGVHIVSGASGCVFDMIQAPQFTKAQSLVLAETHEMLDRGFKEQISIDVIYIHPIGRCGCYERQVVAMNFVKYDDIRILRDIEQCYSTPIDEWYIILCLSIYVCFFVDMGRIYLLKMIVHPNAFPSARQQRMICSFLEGADNTALTWGLQMRVKTC